MQNATYFWDKVAPKYAKRPIADMSAYDRTLARTATYLHESDRVLELGCGTGTTALRLADRVAAYTASDLSPGMIRIAREKAQAAGSAVQFLSADVAERVEGEAPYDAILAFNLLHLLPDLPGTLDSVAARLKPGGVFISKSPCTPDRRPPLSYRMILWVLPALQWLGKAPYVNFMTKDALEGEITAAGFEIVETGDYPAHPPNHFVVARKL